MTQKIEWGGIPGPYELSPRNHWDKEIGIYAGRRLLIEVDYDDMGEDEMVQAEVTARAAAEIPAMVHQLRAVRAAVGMLGGLGPLQYAGAIDTIQKTTDAILARIDGEG